MVEDGARTAALSDAASREMRDLRGNLTRVQVVLTFLHLRLREARMMIKLLAVAAMGAVLGVGSANASTYEFDFAGTVTASSVSLFSGPAPDFSAVLGRSFTSQFVFNDVGGVLSGQGSVTLDLSGHPGQFLAPAEIAGQQTGTYTANLGPDLTMMSEGSYTGHVTSVIGPTFDFVYNPATAEASIAADFAASAIDRADDSGSINLTLTATSATSSISPVPLPASAPLFGAALFALGAVGYGIKRKQAAASA